MGDQETLYLRNLHLSTVCDRQNPSAFENSAKRSRPEIHPSLPPSTSVMPDLEGFKKVTLPDHFRAASSPPLRRTLSEPIPAFSQPVAVAAGTPPLPPHRSTSFGESPSSKRLKRMKERLREMSHWWSQVAEDDNDETFESENYCTDKNALMQEEPCQEAVFVERSGECLVLHFKCPCGNGYQILLSGNDCYYKLTTFRS